MRSEDSASGAQSLLQTLRGSGETVLGQISGLKESRFTDFLADAVGMPQRRMNRIIGHTGLSIVTHFVGHTDKDTITMSYRGSSGRRQGEDLAFVRIHDHHDFINLHASYPIRGEGNIAEVPGAVEALLEDAQIAAAAILKNAPPSRSMPQLSDYCY